MSNEILHRLVTQCKDLAIELEKIPTLREFTNKYGQDHLIRDVGGYNIVVTAAGLQNYGERRKRGKINKDLLRADIYQVVESFEHKEIKPSNITERILCLGDTHFPFVHKPSLEKIYSLIIELKPTVIIQMGDLYDAYSHSKFPRSQNIYTPEDEERLGRQGAEEMWNKIKELSPKSKKYQILGNHDLRMLKQTVAAMPSIEHAVRKYLIELMSFPGVTTIEDYRSELVIDGIMFHHGYRSKLGDHANYVLGNMVVAHTHHGGCVFRRLRDYIIWELNCGFLGDADAKALSYTNQKTTTQTLGVGFIDHNGPRFIPF